MLRYHWNVSRMIFLPALLYYTVKSPCNGGQSMGAYINCAHSFSAFFTPPPRMHEVISDSGSLFVTCSTGRTCPVRALAMELAERRQKDYTVPHMEGNSNAANTSKSQVAFTSTVGNHCLVI